jgi:DNA-binding LytR/AlgR family response regulator
VENLLKILIVDDEPEARELLAYMLGGEEGIRVVGMAGNVDEALQKLDEEHPDLVFLDIHMPDKDGFQFIEMVNQNREKPGIIFVTAFDNYAIQAIRNSVFDYILKPIRREEIIGAIKRFRQRIDRSQDYDLSKLISALKGSEEVIIKLNTRSGYILIHPREVVYCKADGNYTHLQMANGANELTTQNLGAIEELLESGAFFRVSRSYLVNLKYLARVDRKSSLCVVAYHGESCSIKIPAQRIRMLESSFR